MTVTEAPPRRPDQRTLSGVPSLPVQRRRSRLGGIAVGQIVACEVAAIAVVGVLGRPVWVQASIGVVVLVLLLAAFARRDGRWWYESLWLRREFRRRARAAATATGADPVAANLARIAPEFSVTDVVHRRTRFGVGRDQRGFFVAFEALPWRDGDGRRAADFGLDQLAGLLTSTAAPLSALQVVMHVVPAPTGALDWRAPCTSSYLELLKDAVVPADQRVWVAGRLTPEDADSATGRGDDLPGMHRALAAVVGRLEKALEAAGAPGQVLDATHLASAVAMVAGIPNDVAGRNTVAGREEWQSWQTAEAVHVGFALTDLPQRPLPEFLGQLCRTRLLAATVSIVLTAGRGDEILVEGLLRVSAPHDEVDETVRRVTELCRAAGATVRRLDGQHAVAVYAVAPTGGGAHE